MTTTQAPTAAPTDCYTVTVISKSFDAPVIAHYTDRIKAAKGLRGAAEYPGFVRGKMVRIATGEVLRTRTA